MKTFPIYEDLNLLLRMYIFIFKLLYLDNPFPHLPDDLCKLATSAHDISVQLAQLEDYSKTVDLVMSRRKQITELKTKAGEYKIDFTIVHRLLDYCYDN